MCLVIASAGVKEDTSVRWNIMQPLKPESSLKGAYVRLIWKKDQNYSCHAFQLGKIIK